MNRGAATWVVGTSLVAAAWSCASDGGSDPGESRNGGAAGATETGGTAGAGRGGRETGSGAGGEAGDAPGRGGASGKAGSSGAGGAGGGGDDTGTGGSAGSDGGEGGEATGDDPCSPNPCLHSGACRASAGEPICKCKVGFSGQRCETDVGVRYQSMDMRDTHWCGILDDGRIDCRGGNAYGEASPPPGRFTQVEVGQGHSCALRDDGRLVCFGDDTDAATAAPSGTFTQLSTRYSASCAIRTDGSVVCWGGNTPLALEGTFREVSVGLSVCGIRTDGTLACAGGVPTTLVPPAGTYRRLSLGLYHACAITTADTVACWGSNYESLRLQRGDSLVPLSGTFTSVSAGDYETGETCGVRTDGSMLCWSAPRASNGSIVVQTTSFQGSFKDAVIGEERTCALRDDGLVVCRFSSEPREPSGTFLDVSTGSGVCGIRPDQSGVCFANVNTTPFERPGPFSQLSGGGLACSLAPNGTFVSVYGEAVPSGTFTQASAGLTNRTTCCGVRASGVLSCFGYLTESTPISVTVRQAALSYKDGCALALDGSLVCWGANGSGQATPPSGTFSELSRGPNHGCAVRADATLACWGRNDDGESTPPAGRFRQVSASGAHSCGIRENGQMACWGANGSGQSSPPAGTFTKVSAGGLSTCALASDASIVCWGERRADYGPLLP